MRRKSMRSAPSRFDAIVVDLDGTIIDCAARHYAWYADISNRFRLPCLDASSYWAMKRRKASWSEIASKAGGKVHLEYFEREFLASIEDPAYLRLDTLYDGASSALSRLRDMTSSLILATMRRHTAPLEHQLNQLG